MSHNRLAWRVIALTIAANPLLAQEAASRLDPPRQSMSRDRVSLAGQNAIRFAYGRAIPVGSENLSKGWSTGPSLSVSWEHYLRQSGSDESDISLGIVYERSTHPFDEGEFVSAIRPNGNQANSAEGQQASITNLGAFARGTAQNKHVKPFGSVGFGFFSTNRGSVRYTSSSGNGTLDMGSKSGVFIGGSLGVDLAFGNNALMIEGGYVLGASQKDEEENVDYQICYSGGGCSTPKKQTQLVIVRAGIRRLLARGFM